MRPKISVIVPCYNHAQYLDECLQSVLDQTYQAWECIIVNDGSPDNTEEVAKKWTEKDSRFKYLKKENGGLSSARNAGIETAGGEWILPLDADDLIHQDYLLLASGFFDKDYKVITSNARFFGSFDRPWIFPAFSFENLLCRNTLFCTSFFRKSDWKAAGKFDESMRKGFEDWEFWIRLLQLTPKDFHRIEKELFYYRKKDTSMLIELNEAADEVKKYIYIKHRNLYEKTFGGYMKLLEENQNLKGGIQTYKNILNSRRFKLANSIFIAADTILNKFNFRK